MNTAPKQTTLCFLIRDDQVLLAMKKRGFGKGKWNGTGGKCQPGETPEAAAIRETEEEIGITPLSLEKTAIISFRFPAEKADWNQDCHAFLVSRWEGEPTETEEMAPCWFGQDALPFDQMWPDDPFWLPLALNGTKLVAKFSFDEEQRMLENYSVRQVAKL